jgi:hypothetical protein
MPNNSSPTPTPRQYTRAMSGKGKARSGFDILAKKILALNNENNSSLRTSFLENDKALTAAVATGTRRVKSLFKNRLGKGKPDVADVTSTPQSLPLLRPVGRYWAGKNNSPMKKTLTNFSFLQRGRPFFCRVQTASVPTYHTQQLRRYSLSCTLV